MAEPCLVCSGSSSETLFEGPGPESPPEMRYRLRQCLGCRLAFVDPRPAAAELEAFYKGAYYQRPRPGVAALLEPLLHRLMSGRLRRLSGLEPGRLLDIGCGDGSFLADARKSGWQAYGVEISSTGYEAAKQKPGIEVKNRPLEECGWPREYFDAVTLWHCLEHVERPPSLLREIRRAISPRGRLWIALPNIRGWEFALFRGDWFHLDPPRHLYHFSPGTLERLLDQAGFRVDRVDHFSWEYNPFGFFQSGLNRMSTEMNFLYKKLKGIPLRKPALGHVLLNGAVALAAGPWLAPLSFVYSSIAGLCRRGGCIEVEATVR